MGRTQSRTLSNNGLFTYLSTTKRRCLNCSRKGIRTLERRRYIFEKTTIPLICLLELEDRPSYEFRHNVAKTFLELEQPRLAAEIWEGMLEEDDNIAEVWYYLGLAYRKFNSRVAQENLEKARDVGDFRCLKLILYSC